MFSNLFYLFILIDKSVSIYDYEKSKIFNYAKNNPDEALRLIRVFEQEQKQINYVKNDYKKNIGKIWKDFVKDYYKK